VHHFRSQNRGSNRIPVSDYLQLRLFFSGLERVGFAGARNQRYLQLWSGAA
jgi:hypothetical protein